MNPHNAIPSNRFFGLLGGTLALVWLVLAIEPLERSTWLLENVLAVAGVALLVVSRNAFPLSRLSYVLIFSFLCVHLVGAHYTYSATPYDAWSQQLFGVSINTAFGWERNHFDRFVHFSYGLMLVYPMREVFLRIANVRGFWGYFLPLDLTMSTSMIYELIEWGAAVSLGAGSTEFLGTQGDIWDAHIDMALATLGGVVAMALVLLVHLLWQRDFAREFIESLRVKDPRPLGEVALDEMLHGVERGGASDPP